MPRFYIVQKSNWQGDNWKPTAGPFPTRREAEAEVPTYEYHPHTALGLDTKSERHAKVVSRTELNKLGYGRGPEGEARLAHDSCLNRENWLDFITG